MNRPRRSLSRTSSGVQRLVVRRQAGGGEGVDLGERRGGRRAWPSTTPRALEGGAGSCPRAGHATGSPGSRPPASPSPRRARRPCSDCARNCLLLVIAEMAAAPFVGGGRHGRAGQREDLQSASRRGAPSARIRDCAGRRHWRTRGSPRRSRCSHAAAPGPPPIPASGASSRYACAPRRSRARRQRSGSCDALGRPSPG